MHPLVSHCLMGFQCNRLCTVHVFFFWWVSGHPYDAMRKRDTRCFEVCERSTLEIKSLSLFFFFFLDWSVAFTSLPCSNLLDLLGHCNLKTWSFCPPSTPGKQGLPLFFINKILLLIKKKVPRENRNGIYPESCTSTSQPPLTCDFHGRV